MAPALRKVYDQMAEPVQARRVPVRMVEALPLFVFSGSRGCDRVVAGGHLCAGLPSDRRSAAVCYSSAAEQIRRTSTI